MPTSPASAGSGSHAIGESADLFTLSGTPSAVHIGGQEHNPGSGQTGALVSQASPGRYRNLYGQSITPMSSCRTEL